MLDPSAQAPPLLSGPHPLVVVVQRFDPIAAMHAHAHLGSVGLLHDPGHRRDSLYKLIPMFALSQVQSCARAGLEYCPLNLGLIGSFVR